MLETPHGVLWTAVSKPTSSSGATNPTILFLHGNSSSSKIFDDLLSNPTLHSNYPLLVFDLPGHGSSKDAPDPEQSYTQPSYADATLHVLRHYGVNEVIILGWSLGGHNAIEILPLLSNSAANSTGIKCLGIMVIGTPPAKGQEQISEGFKGDLINSPAGMVEISDDLKIAFADAMTKIKPSPDWLREVVKRTDGRAREVMFRAFKEERGSDQVKVVQEWEDGWVAIVNGKDDPYVNVKYCAQVGKGCRKLWKGPIVEFEGCEHAPFYEDPEAFKPVFLKFVEDCTKLRKA